MHACIHAVNVAPQIAFYDPMMRNFSKKKIAQRRDYHRSLVEVSEITDLDINTDTDTDIDTMY